MGAPDPTRAFLPTGKLYKNVTGFTAGVPDDGTVLGVVGDIELRQPRRFRILTREEDGSPSGIVWLGGPVIMAFRAREWSSDTVANLIHGGAAGANGPKITWPNGVGVIPATANNIVFSPIDTDQPTVVIYKPQVIPDPSSDIGLRLSAYKFLDFRGGLIGTPAGASDETGIMAQAADIVLAA